jgi:hypothetical protein
LSRLAAIRLLTATVRSLPGCWITLRQARQEASDDSVSQALNLAAMLARLDRPQEALAAIPQLQAASAYGRGAAAYVRVMIATELKDADALDTALAEVCGLAPAFPELRQDALVVAGRDEEAASVLRERLADPGLRTAALIEIQNYPEDPAPPRVLQWRARGKALAARPEVRHEISQFGRVNNYELAAIGGE